MRKLVLLHIMLLYLIPVLYAQKSDSTDQITSEKIYKELFSNVPDHKIYLRNITISGNKVTRRSVIMRELSVEEGVYLHRDSLELITELNRKRVFNLAIFNDVQVFIDTVGDRIVDWEIVVKEQWYLIPEFTFKLADRNVNVWWVEHNHDIRRANIGVTLKNRNFRGNLEQAGVTAQIGYTQKFGLSYFRPYVDKRQRHGFGVQFYYYQNEEWYFKTDSNKWQFARTPGSYVVRTFEAAGSYHFRPEYATKHLFELRYKDQWVNDTFLTLNRDYYLNHQTQLQLIEFLYRFDLNKVDNWSYPMQGFKTVVHAIARFGIKGFQFQNQYSIEAGYFHKLRKKVYTSVIFRGRLSFPEKQPYVYVYAMGTGSEFMRGYEYYVIDGSQYGLMRFNLKYELLNKVIRNIPFRYIASIPVRFYPKIFADVGYCRNAYPGNSYLNNRPLYSAGIGLDIVTAYDVKLRLEYAWNHLGEKGLFLHTNSE